MAAAPVARAWRVGHSSLVVGPQALVVGHSSPVVGPQALVVGHSSLVVNLRRAKSRGGGEAHSSLVVRRSSRSERGASGRRQQRGGDQDEEEGKETAGRSVVRHQGFLSGKGYARFGRGADTIRGRAGENSRAGEFSMDALSVCKSVAIFRVEPNPPLPKGRVSDSLSGTRRPASPEEVVRTAHFVFWAYHLNISGRSASH